MDKDITNLAEIFKALANPIRLKIVIGLLEKSECNVGLMAKKLNISQPNVSQHLILLKNAGVVEGYRKGTQICYKVVDATTKKIIKALNI
jgi:ArsR family transcriptional regulator